MHHVEKLAVPSPTEILNTCATQIELIGSRKEHITKCQHMNQRKYVCMISMIINNRVANNSIERDQRMITVKYIYEVLAVRDIQSS